MPQKHMHFHPSQAPSLAVVMFLVVSLLTGFGCSESLEEPGVVARVNGEPILLVEIEAVHDLKYLGLSSRHGTSMHRLQEEYGNVLAEILVQRLVAQFLDGRNLAVCDQEVEAAEQQVLADYPEGAFEQMLIEEYIHLERWREQLRAGLHQEKLIQKVLRPTVSIDYLEVDAYYRENIADFYLQPRVRFLLIQGQDRELVATALERFATETDTDMLDRRFGAVEVQVHTLREDNIPGDWQALLSGLEPQEATELLSRGPGGYQVLVLLERTEGRIIDPAQAYPLVERILLEKKLHLAFDTWLADALQYARVEVNEHLLTRQ
ncbi:MAG: peptidyl-prolyl cis-trans isomerase [Desulfovibrionales bacterium]|nr:MAG: peptidyl-prolyl cis-trans isomerase [Desulfovibrionales bacterium]